MSTKMRVLLSFEYNDIEPGSREEEIIVNRLEGLVREVQKDYFSAMGPNRVSVHDIQFYSIDIGGWV